ncbi:MAG: lysostaphin resistance A-like protein [Haloferacaceae archaeon]
MTDWPAFAGFAGVVLAALLLLAHLSQAAIDHEDAGASGRDVASHEDAGTSSRDVASHEDASTSGRDVASHEEAGASGRDVSAEATVAPGREGRSERGTGARVDADGPPDRTAEPERRPGGSVPPVEGDVVPEEAGGGDPSPEAEPNLLERSGPPSSGPPPTAGPPSTGVLLANVALSQGVLGTLLVAGAWYTGVPPAALGAGAASLSVDALAAGVAVGLALYAANEAGAAVGRRVGFGGGEELRRALAPDSTGGWAALLLIVLPVIAGFEELLFRGVLVGAFHAGFGVSPWLLAGLSSVAFAAGHGAQGRVGVVVTGTLGFALAAAFVVTGSLLTVVVAHYLVNALEFLVHEWAGIDPGAGEWRPG